MTHQQLLTLRNGKPLSLFNRSQKQFIKIQLNRTYKGVAWERWISLDRQNWIKHNWHRIISYLSLKDVRAVLQYYKNINMSNSDNV